MITAARHAKIWIGALVKSAIELETELSIADVSLVQRLIRWPTSILPKKRIDWLISFLKISSRRSATTFAPTQRV